MKLRHGSLCSGYGGLDLAIAEVFGAATIWLSDIDKGARKVLAHRFPGVPNIGDMTTVDWATVEPVDILSGGYPCQPFSHAGKRKGSDDERHLWPYIREAIRHLRPRLTLLENVAGHRSLGFDRVLGDLAEDGMDVVWTSLRASDIGAAHRRERLFIGVTPADAARVGHERAGRAWGRRPGSEDGGLLPAQPGMPLLPTPVTNDMGEGKTVEAWGRYAAAIHRWESLTRPAPAPTETGPKGNPRLSAEFSSWLMGLPTGWITDVPDITRTEALHLAGNGVVPQQAVAALRFLLAVQETPA